MSNYDAWRTTPADSSPHAGILTEACDHFCHEPVFAEAWPCEDGCLPADADATFTRRWVCVGGTRYRMYDTRED